MCRQRWYPRVAQDLGLTESMLYSWRSKRRQTGQPFEEQKLQQAELSRLKRGNARLEEEVAFLKKGGSVLCENAQVKYAMMNGNEDHFPVGMMCRLLSVSRSGCYSWKNRPLSSRDLANQKLLIEIKRGFEQVFEYISSVLQSQTATLKIGLS